MTALSAVLFTIRNDATVTGLVGTRVYPDFLPEDSQKPAVIAYVSTEVSENVIDGFLGFETATIRVEAYGRSRSEADGVIQAARMSLNGMFGVVNGTPIKSLSQNTGILHLIDKPNDGTDRWQFRSVQSFDVSYNSFSRD